MFSTYFPHSRWRVRATPICNSEFARDAFWRIWRAVSAATNVQDEGQSQLCLEGSACKCSAGSLANNNIGTCQRVSEFMNHFCKLLPAVGGDMQRYWKQLPASVWCQLNQLPPAVGRGMHRGWKMAPADVACKLPPAVGRGMHGG